MVGEFYDTGDLQANSNEWQHVHVNMTKGACQHDPPVVCIPPSQRWKNPGKKAKIFGLLRFPPTYKYTGVHKIVMGMQHPVNYVIASMVQPSNKSQLRVRKNMTDGSHTGVCHGTDSWRGCLNLRFALMEKIQPVAADTAVPQFTDGQTRR